MSIPLPPKKDVALALLERSSVFVYLDPRRDGVVTPIAFKKQPKLVLQVGLNMAVPILDLKFDDQGMSCTLSFNRTPFFCIIPWSAVFALTGDDGQGIVWPEDVPPEIVEAQQQQQRRASLRAVPNEPEPAPAPPPPEAKEAPKKPTKKPRKAAAEGDAPAEKRPRAASKAKAAESATTDGAKAAPKKRAPRKTTPKAEPAAASAPSKAAAPKAAPPPLPEGRVKQPSLFDASPSPAPSVEPAARPAAPSAPPRVGKPKRELPPYLRVVK